MRSFGCACSRPLGRAPTLGAADLLRAGWYRDSTYGYYVDPKKGIAVYRGGKQVSTIPVGTSKYSQALASMFGANARDPATATTRKGAGLAAGSVDPQLVAKGIDVSAAAVVALLNPPKKPRRSAPGVDLPPPGPESGFPSWTPYAVGGGLLLLVGIMLTRPAPPASPRAPAPARAA